MRIFSATIACAMLLACDPVCGAEKNAAGYSSIHSVGIISAIGHKIALAYVGTTALGNSYDEIVTDDWKIDDYIASKIASALPAGMGVKAVPYDKEAFATPAITWLLESEVPVTNLTKKLGNPGGIDAYIVVFPVASPDSMFEAVRNVRGLGLYKQSFFGNPQILAAYAVYAIDLIDAHTNKEIVRVRATWGNYGFRGPRTPLLAVSPTAWADSAASLTDDQKSVIKAALISLIDQTLPRMISSLDLPADPAELSKEIVPMTPLN